LQLRQPPIPGNALGKVKFLFPNEYDVYLHDTPSKSLFARARRAFSHGCVRVQNPQALAEWLLRGRDDWSAERIDAAMKGSRQIQVNLKESVPVALIYHTTAVEDGNAYFFDDIYGLNKTGL
jgi:murein L,D-transpeptidase YcbB/YkuD